LFTALITTTERERRKARETELEAAVTYKVQWEHELERRRRLGIVTPDPLPHPDHLVIDVGEGTVSIKGRVAKLTVCLNIMRFALGGNRNALQLLKSVWDRIADDLK
jgi:hypothetical protein